ncbi:hypothetical protein DFQ28_007660 [Apophysomyces sp. BC1034]|nr:hypothetical protein DFQ30_006511 [Apophysomyces sp. BC1015]KAG0176899.1 hypothetical protein DFQ29_005490 [Apophysomyces sp. BC1021]KAG0186515.1 hypothetical protein DFQ28_007660 [Apophysomyces sp. BC1034]
MSKRQAENEDLSQSKRVRRNNDNHAAGCNDAECEGCDVGEVEISFVQTDDAGEEQATQPTAQELLTMALEEKDMEMTRRLFDMALERFQKDEPDNRIDYAACLVELGRSVQVEESIREGLDILRHEMKNAADLRIRLKLAQAAIALATCIRKQKNALFEQLQNELEDSDGEEDEIAAAELVKKQEITKEEIKLYKEAVDAVDKVFGQLDKGDEQLVEEVWMIMHDMYSYSQLMDQPSHQEQISTVSDTIIRYVQLFPYEDNDNLLTLWAASLLNKQKFLDEAENKMDLCDESEKLLDKSSDIYVNKHGRDSAWIWELRGMLKLTQSNLAENEDDILTIYDEAVTAFSKALELNPENKKLAETVAMLNGTQSEGDE